MIPLLVALAGGLGAAVRFALDAWITARWSPRLPIGTLVVNVSGSLFLGLLTGWAMRVEDAPWLVVVGIGLLGGYTTFSTASVEAARLARDGRGVGALAHALGMAVLGLAAASLGLWITSD